MAGESKVIAQGREFTMERVFRAPRELVYAAFTEAEHLKAWFGPQGWILSVCEIDFRPGGTWFYCMKCVDPNQGDVYGMESWGKTFYDAITHLERIDYRDYFSDAEGNLSQQFPVAHITLTFEDAEDDEDDRAKTRVVTRALYESEDALQKVMQMGMEQGIKETWDALAKYVEGKQA